MKSEKKCTWGPWVTRKDHGVCRMAFGSQIHTERDMKGKR